jgi:hypothetical protein
VEQGTYTVVTSIDSFDSSGVPITEFYDATGSEFLFYRIDFFDPLTNKNFDDFSIGIFPFTPREKRLIAYIVGWVPDVMKPDLNDFEVGTALKLAINEFNVFPPQTFFNINSYPTDYEQYLIVGAQVHLAMLKYLKISIRDFSYSDAGFALNIDRGTKIAKAAEDLRAVWHQVIERAKWNLTTGPLGLGSTPLPISMGSSLNRGLLNVLDIFQMMGR